MQDKEKEGVEEVPKEELAEAHDPLEDFNKTLNKMGVALAALLHSLFNGDFDSDLKALASEQQPADALAGLEHGDLAAAIRNFTRQASHSTMVVSSSTAAPKPSMRVLSRIDTDPDADHMEVARSRMMQERATVWKKAQAQRQKFVQFGVWRSKTTQGLEAVLKKAQAVAGFRGTLNEAHRGYFFSADLVSEAGASPWSKECVAKGPAVDACLSFMLAQQGETDFLFACDGRSRSIRRALEDTFTKTEAGKRVEELWTVFAGRSSTEYGDPCFRKVSLAANNTEMIFVKILWRE